ncbi:MAG: hypothetical protein IPK26_28345 [Planctomycetes bacterium]|nr:hypothetical protein [Planctomycetota bacterium]
MLQPRHGAAALTATLLCVLSTAQAPGTTVAGERVPASAISPLVLEPMSVVLERERTMIPATRDLPTWNGQDGRWLVPPDSAATSTHSGIVAIANEWGDPRMPIGFPTLVDVHDVWVGGHGVLPARALRVVGWRGATEVARTEWLAVGRDLQRLALDFRGVDRIDFEAAARSSEQPFAWFAIDDLRYRPAGHATDVTLDFEDLGHRQVLDGTGYRGLVWSRGNGFRVKVEGADQVPAPREETPEIETAGTAGGGSPQFLGAGPTSPRVWNDTQGTTQGDPGATLIPPDTCGTVGPDHVIVITNSNLSAFRKSNNQRVLNVSLGAFWNVGGLIGDPRAVWDPHANRYIVLAETFSTGGLFYYAISQTADPAGAWFKFSFATASGSDAGRWPDYVTLGVDARGIYSAAYMVTGSALMTLWAIDKAPLLAPTPAVGTITAFRSLPFEGAIQPCVTYGDPGAEYCVSRQSSTGLRIRRVNPPLISPTLTEMGIVTVTSQSSPPTSPALGSTTNISTGDARPQNAVFRNGSIYTTQTISVGGRAGCRWYQIRPTPLAVLQWGNVSDPLWHYYYPSIYVDRDNNIGLGFSGSHAGVYCSTFLTGRHASDPNGVMAPPILTKAGEASWVRLDGSGRNRFGDYSHGGVDPVDDRGFWTLQEYIAPSANTWRIRINRFGYESFNYGDGLAGTSGTVPTLRTTGRPLVGTTLNVEVGNSGGLNPAPGVLLMGFAAASIPTMGGTVLVNSTASTSIPVPTPRANVPIAVPPGPALVGVQVFFQAGQIDAGAPQLVAFSRGLEIRCGSL